MKARKGQLCKKDEIKFSNWDFLEKKNNLEGEWDRDEKLTH